MAYIGNGYDDSTDRDPSGNVVFVVYLRAMHDYSEIIKLVGDPQPHGKRGKKGKSNKDWNKG